jgi:hypothetical protein
MTVTIEVGDPLNPLKRIIDVTIVQLVKMT